MNCFVIMPYSAEFDDVYAAIKSSVQSALKDAGTCSRLDESRPAGRITDRLVGELQSATMCLVDLTGLRPNVMWELGYAMALGKPAIIITQDPTDLPFDIHDLQKLSYDRHHISRTLGEPLKRMIIDTAAIHGSPPAQSNDSKARDELIGTLLGEVQLLKSMLGDAVKAWAPHRETEPEEKPDVSAIEGSWCNTVSHSHYYAKVIRGELVAPYCYQGNEELTGVYFDWRKTGEHWFARFAWLEQPISGFVFLKHESLDMMSGAWWYEYEVTTMPTAPPPQAGIPSRWKREHEQEVPAWARRFHERVQEEGLAACLRSFQGVDAAKDML